jgi:hypothetical protein
VGEAGAVVARSPEDLREVGNYVVALEHGIARLGKIPICVRLVRELHIELLSANPFITATGAARRLNIAFTTALRTIQRLEKKRVVKRTTEARRNRVYCAQELLDIFEEPAQLKPISSV